MAANRIEWTAMAEQGFSAVEHGYSAANRRVSKAVQVYLAANRIELQAATVKATAVEATRTTLMPEAAAAAAPLAAKEAAVYGFALNYHLACSVTSTV